MSQLNTGEWKRQRRRALERDSYMCVTCGEPANEVDHIVSRADGGTHALENLRTLCTPCHKQRTRWQAKARAQHRRARRRTTSTPPQGGNPFLKPSPFHPTALLEETSPPVGGVQDWFPRG